MLPSRLWLAVPLVAVVVTLSACSVSSPSGGSSAGATAASPGSASSAPSAPAGSVSTDGVCGLVPLAKVNSILKRSYIDSKEIPLPDFSISNAAYCLYGTASAPGEFAINVANGDPATAVTRFNDATGDKLEPQPGFGDSAMYTSEYPELLVIWDSTVIVVGQSGFEKGDATITLTELEKLATAVHAAG
ncbi:MAG: hypothetical protein ABIS08_01515 [Pseudolysinimonas sp.]